MLKAHFAYREKVLLALSDVAANAGHTLHRGTPREFFVREFLQDHLSERLAIGTGEIIDADSDQREKRNQIDIVIYKPEYPRLNLGGGVNAFLAESVVATIEVKSLLDRDALQKAITSASRCKKLKRNFNTAFVSGYVPPGILSYVVAFKGPEKVTTVASWLDDCESKMNLNQRPMPQSLSERTNILSESLEGIFCLGCHSLVFDNAPLSWLSDEDRIKMPQEKWYSIEESSSNLMLLFVLLSQAGANAVGQWPKLSAYLRR